ncbi:RluA family pseudouridine synthase [Flavobacterium sp. JP2137]|uniref:RluA family pseudouridine synthase n=1 Tax=Flavobacterium sp. JP2137 TaxID=3414510 RepID=UPI003D301244
MNLDPSDNSPIWHRYHSDVSHIALPDTFTFPFYYEPHALAKTAAAELQQFLTAAWPELQGGVDQNSTALGKMFGVLVVQNADKELGYLTAYSGKLPPNKAALPFVPPIFDAFHPTSFFLEGESTLNALHRQIETLERAADYLALQDAYSDAQKQAQKSIQLKKADLKHLKSERKAQRSVQQAILDHTAYEHYHADLIKQSLRDKHELNLLIAWWKGVIDGLAVELSVFEKALTKLRNTRKNTSNALQARLFEQYQFLNARGETRDVVSVFQETALLQPPAAAGDCAAPRLLQYAYKNDLKPVALAEFWWGASPKSEIRQHGYFYPACRGKCEPILTHMLQGLNVDENPLLVNPALGVDLEIIYEDDYMVVVNKPAEFLSVPGIYIQDSVYQRMKMRYPKATGPLIVHRLDMSTSGLLVIAKDKASHQQLQSQFIKRRVKKRYTALLNGMVSGEQGEIELPLRVDLDDRPRQLVCYEHGKPAKTQWQVIDRLEGQTRVHFWPISGRTHQLRVHAAHQLGLGCAIVGDDLYGQKSNRLHLHAEVLELTHPFSGEALIFRATPPF